MGLKDRAKEIMAKAGVPVVPGYQGGKQDAKFLEKESEKIGYPVLIKAVAGGGGKGMRLVEKGKDFAEALASCKREAQSSFGNDHVLVEKYITKPRHIEVQVFGDSHGNAVYLFERDCSLQRRHQKVVEEAPAPGLPEAVRKKLGEAAVKAVKAIGYTNAGTIEFIMDSKTHDFFFMEMNTRLQVEHPVTEMITGQDLVEWQLLVAAGGKLPLAQKDLHINGHAFEVRLYAEDPAGNFLPQTGRVTRFLKPEGEHVRVDTGIAEGDEVTIHYDPMIAKLIVWGEDREAAMHLMSGALAGTSIAGLRTNQEFLANVFASKAFAKGDVDTGFIAGHEKELLPETYSRPGRAELALASVWFLLGLNQRCHSESQAKNLLDGREILRSAQDDISSSDPWDTRDNWRMNGILTTALRFVCRGEDIHVSAVCRDRKFDLTSGKEKIAASFVSLNGDALTVDIGGAPVTATVVARGNDLTIFHKGRAVLLHLHVHGSGADDQGGEGRIIAPMQGRIVAVMVGKGDAVDKDQPLLVMEAMKMEMTIRAGVAGVVGELSVAVNDQVQDGALLVSIENKK
jgi:3-methylcrotonyl-CoA carboxylase alpha subunit